MAELQDVIHLAASRGDLKEVMSLLLDDPSLSDAKNERGGTILHSAAEQGREEVVAYLLDCHEGLIEQEDSHGDTALHLAARNGHYEVAQMLVVVNPRLAILPNNEVQAAVHVAIIAGFDLIVALLLPLSLASLSFHNPLHLAAEHGRDAVVAQLLAARPEWIDSVDSYGMTALHFAAAAGHCKVVAQLLAAKPTLIESQEDWGKTALGVAVMEGHEAVVAQLLAASPSSISQETFNQESLLHLAKSPQIISRLLAANPDMIHTLDSQKNNVLQSAAIYRHTAVMIHLLDLKPELATAVNSAGDTPLRLVVQVRCGYPIDIEEAVKEAEKVVPLFLIERILRLFPEAVRVVDRNGFTPLRIAYHHRTNKPVSALLLPLCFLDDLASAEWFPEEELEHLVDTHCSASLLEVMHSDVVSIVYEYIIGPKPQQQQQHQQRKRANEEEEEEDNDRLSKRAR